MAGTKRKSAVKDTTATDTGGGRRRSLRVSSSAQKSQYFDADSESEADAGDEVVSKKSRGKGRPAKKAKVEVESEGDDGDDYQDEPQDAEPEDEDEDDDSDDDAPPQVTFIPLPKLRDTGGIEYADDRLHPNTLAFLRDLKANNKRSWLKSHDAEYRRALQDWETYLTTLTTHITTIDPTIPDLPFKDINFRIYRDIRFSHDPTPYKPHFSAAFSRTGRKGPYACYYVHVEPDGKCFLGGGLWHPDAGALRRLRESIDERPGRWRGVLGGREFAGTFLGLDDGEGNTKEKGKSGGKKGGGRKSDAVEKEKDEGLTWEEKTVKAFAERNKDGALKTRPKGFNPEHRDMQLLKLKNFTVGKKLDDGVFTDEGGQEVVAGVVRDMFEFITHLNRIVMPDPGDDSDSNDEDED
ncbi:uncharacterized protein C8A04DRAFT_35914 [Dichotomopilus funicola]|uniref:Uncharacterized protein n=1 Tax=Dichotomopilus funicola TaxID=1934379 RepID=A0AAN6V660_9PEZI|nr:hypothetical protein C8A04DRAFT_35914 [Dichotomopilus funicola]